VVVAVDVGKATFAVSVTDAGRCRLLGPADFAMTASGLAAAQGCVRAVLPAGEMVVKVGIEAAGRYHRPLLAPSAWPVGWPVLQVNPAHVAEQRRVQGRRRVKTDAIDLDAITELVLAGRGDPAGDRDAVIGELVAWSAHRTRRVETRKATKNQLLGQLDRSFPGLTLALPDVLGTKVGRLVAALDPERIYLFGSQARGDAGPDSDYDLLLLVERPTQPRYRLAQAGFRALRGVPAAVDVVVWDRATFDARLHLKASFPATVVREGALLHAR
jgi:transposase